MINHYKFQDISLGGQGHEMATCPGPRLPTNYLLTENDYYEGDLTQVWGYVWKAISHTRSFLSLHFRARDRPRQHNMLLQKMFTMNKGGMISTYVCFRDLCIWNELDFISVSKFLSRFHLQSIWGRVRVWGVITNRGAMLMPPSTFGSRLTLSPLTLWLGLINFCSGKFKVKCEFCNFQPTVSINLRLNMLIL